MLSVGFATLGLAPDAAVAQSSSFQSFLQGLWPEAQKRGVSRATFEAAFAGVTPDPKVMELTRRQPEFRETTEQYLAKRVSDARISNGREKAQMWAQWLEAIENHYGVDRYIVLSVWGNETNYGGYMGGHNVITALATLASNHYRGTYFRTELLNALDIIQQGHVAPRDMIGSWAGAMGHTQFMPSSFKSDAVDFTNDGRRDIWNTIPDALASTANYLKRRGWRTGETWGYEVALPRGFDFNRARRMGKVSVAQWMQMGVQRVNNQAFPRPSDEAWLHLPAGARGPAFLMLRNFDVIKRYNNSNNYALAVGHLADRIRGGGPFVASWPPDDRPLSSHQALELQQLLSSRGFEVGKIDGKIGPNTRDAIQAFQAARGLPADGHPTQDLLNQLKRN